MPPDRRLAAIMFTDIVGYTALMARDEEAARAARDRHEAVVRPLVEKYHGEWIERTGDETLSAFPSALDAVNCALAAQAELDGDAELQLRVGIHHGDVTFDDAGVSGDGVNVAARVRPMAKPGGICITGDVHHSVRGRSSLEFEALGEQDFKNVDHPVPVFAVSGTAEPPRLVSRPAPETRPRTFPRAAWGGAVVVAIALGAVWWLSRTTIDTSPIRSIAVLPLENLSGDPEQEYFADGMTEALIGDVAKLGSLSVISRTSVMRYKESDLSLPEIARELNVDAILEGTVMRAGNRVRITAQMIDARNDHHLWAERYERELSEVLALQSDVARAVAQQVRLRLSPTTEAALTPRSVEPEAYNAYLRGLQLRGPPHLALVWGPVAIDQMEQALAIDPTFAEAWVGLAQARQLVGASGFDVRYTGLLGTAREAAERALAINPAAGAAHAVVGAVRLNYDWDFPGARRSLARAVELSPNDPFVHRNYLTYLICVVDSTGEARRVFDQLLRVAPLDPTYQAVRVQYFFYSRDYERALEEAEAIRRSIDPDFVDLEIVNSLAMLERFDEAHREYMAFMERGGPAMNRLREAHERGYQEGGMEGAMRAAVHIAAAREGQRPVNIALMNMGLDHEEALSWLERGYRERDSWMVWVKAHPLFDPLRSDPRFQDLLRRIGFPES